MKFSKIMKQLGLIGADIAFVFISLMISLFIRFDGDVASAHVHIALIHGLFIAPLFVITFSVFKLYNSLWAYVSVKELIMIVSACLIAAAISTGIETMLPQRLPYTIMIALFLLMVFFTAGLRVSYRLLRGMISAHHEGEKVPQRRAMIIGAGDAGSIVIREMMTNPQIQSVPVVVIDDNKNKQGQIMMGIPVAGGADTIAENVKKYNIDEIIFAIPSASLDERKRILQICTQTGCALLMMASQTAFFNRKRISGMLRPVNIEDLLGRKEIRLDIPSIAGYLTGKTVMITGGGGSIGSEIARQLMHFHIRKLILLDIYENCVYDLYNEMVREYGEDLPVEVLIASIRDRERLATIFSTYKPDIVFHAAAHKHVPLMEANPGEAIKNNVFGTLNLADISDEHGVERFILISTDKAVNPANIMGATKRIAEMLIQSMDKRSATKFMAVRFGNVLGSSGSVIPLFQKQIETGGPVTITHPDIERFFMTIPEAAQLVIQAGALANGGEIFVLDMGKPIKIMDLAANMIRLSGMEPGKDIKIEVVGLRPGEKLYEELLHVGFNKTQHDRIFIEKPYDISFDQLQDEILQLLLYAEDGEGIREAISHIVPSYTYHGAVRVAHIESMR